MNLLDDLVVIDFSQFLSGPSAGLRLADMGAQVIKIEKPYVGDICRELYVSDVMIQGESTIFHAINRNKKSYVADLKAGNDLQKIKQLIAKADVLIHNFRPGVMDRLGLGYKVVKALNSSIVYASISGYGNEGPWKDLPGQDLLLQAASGMTWLSNDSNSMPTAMGVAVVDILAGAHLTQGILASLFQRAIKGEGALIEVSLFESALDFQFEVLTCFLNDSNQLPVRSSVNNGHAYISAPYGIYKTSDGHLALSMGNIVELAELLNCKALQGYSDSKNWFILRDEIKIILAAHLLSQSTEFWLSVLIPADIWCSDVLNYGQLIQEQGYKQLNMEQLVTTSNGLNILTTRCPIRVDGQILTSPIGAPSLGEHNELIDQQFLI